MAHFKRYGRPNMAALPPELGKAIFEEILSTPRPDDEKLDAEARMLEKQMLRARERENARKNAAK